MDFSKVDETLPESMCYHYPIPWLQQMLDKSLLFIFFTVLAYKSAHDPIQYIAVGYSTSS